MLFLLALASGFTGPASCAPCHPQQFEKQKNSHHARALRPILATDLPSLLTERPLREPNGTAYLYERAPNALRLTAEREGQRATALLQWAFGAGAQGSTPVGRSPLGFFEHRISWYTARNVAGITVGHPPEADNLLGQVQPANTIYRCFNCHAAGVKPGPDLSSMQPGVTCERCHGPGAEHIRQRNAKSIFNATRFPARAIIGMCGECHRMPDPEKPSLTPEQDDPMSVRFAPVGLMASKCFRSSGRLSCLTCHDAHSDAQHDAAFYSERCLACHDAAPRSSAACPRASRQNCLPCHMPRSQPARDLEFTDHRIRVISDPAHEISEAQAAIDRNPRDEAAYLRLGQVFLDWNTHAPALEVFTDAAQLFPNSPLVTLGRGLALKGMQRFDEAERELLSCLRRDPKLAVAFDALASMYIQTYRHEDADRLSKQFLAANADDYRGYYYQAAALEGLRRDPAEVLELLRKSLDRNPRFAAAHALRGKVLLQQDRAEDAVQALEQAIALRPDYSPAHLYLGNAYRKLGRTAQAAREFQAVRDLKEREQQMPNLRYHRGARPANTP